MRSFGALLLLAFALLPAVAAAGPAPDPAPARALLQGDEPSELVAEFRRFYGKAKTATERYEAVQVLKEVDSLEAAQALLAAFEDEDFNVRRAAVDVVGSFKTPDTAHWLVDGVLLDKKMAPRKQVRGLAAEALGRMKQDFSYWPLLALLDEKDPGLKLAGVAALGSLGNPDACPKLSVLATGTDGGLAVAALDALARIGNGPGAEAAVLAALTHADWRVRARAIEASVQLRLKSSIGPLIERLRVEDGRLAGDAYQALKVITLRDFLDRPDDWADWWKSAEPVFQLPDYAKIAAARAAAEKNGTRYTAAKKQFLGMETRSESILFVIDVSGSMETPFSDPERLKALGRTYRSMQRLEIVKEELIHTVQDLPESTSFNIMAFARDQMPWKKDTVKANVLNKSSAADWISKLRPLGGEKAAYRERLGFGPGQQANSPLSSSSSDEGATNTYGALMVALGEKPDEKGTGDYVTAPSRSHLDTIFFLTDGEPTAGKSVDMFEIRREVQRVNAYRGIQIHVIYVGEYQGEEFEKLAHDNNGIFTAIGG